MTDDVRLTLRALEHHIARLADAAERIAAVMEEQEREREEREEVAHG